MVSNAKDMHISKALHTLLVILTRGTILKSPVVDAFVHLVEPRPERCQTFFISIEPNEYLFPTTEAKLRYGCLHPALTDLSNMCPMLLYMFHVWFSGEGGK